MSVPHDLLSKVRTSSTARTVGHAARTAASASFVREILKICGKAGAAGAVVDGAVGGVQAAKYVQTGAIDTTQAAKHVGAEAGCGFVTSSSGTAGTLAVFMVTGSMGPAALAAGMGASMGSRYVYRQVVGETLPDEDELEQMHRRPPQQGDAEPNVEDIGPGAQASSADDIEDIGPSSGAASEVDASPEEPSAETGRDGAPSDEADPSDDDGGDDVWEDIGPDSE
jgi:hypothetical protein